ncbi:GM21098 [Drosophila sechellia]|uniref:GM21098 n=1 Tax=Drosophila sechellia TaxID=7238 RepID=B4HSM6_DROSE|nr:GM21098 [Drosophila sechellia]
MSKPTLYYALFSPPARACILVAKLIGLDLELKPVDFAKKEHLSEEFVKLNPQHQIPVFVDSDGEVYVDSHAIVCFLVAKRAHIDHRMHYENGVLFQVVKDIVARNIYGGEGEYNPRSLTLCHNAYSDLEHFLEQGTFVVGNELSVADVSIHTTLVTLDLLIPVDREKYPQTKQWMERMDKLLPDNEEINLKGARALQTRILSCMAENKAKGQ